MQNVCSLGIIYILVIIHSNEWGITMEQFMRKFTQLNGVKAKVVLEHCLFDRQVFYCDELQTVNDETRIGVVLKGQDKFIDKQKVKLVQAEEDTYIVSDGRLTIQIIVNKL